jgi:hypothetical protein
MSHELDDNVDRRKFIVSLIPKKGLYPQEFLRVVMSLGYNMRGAKAKVKELKFLRMVEEKEGKVYARTEESK